MKHAQILSVLNARTIARFRKSLTKSGDCLVYTGHKNSNGYGIVAQMVDGVRQSILAHRLAWSLANGQDPPDGLIVCHSCNNPSCCEPSHLYAGTPKQNSDDKVAAGNQSRAMLGVKGRNHPRATYTQEQIDSAIQLLTTDCNFSRASKALGIPRLTLGRWWSEWLQSRK